MTSARSSAFNTAPDPLGSLVSHAIAATTGLQW
jgi:hypothetical protein